MNPNVDELPRLESRHAAAMKFFGTVADTSDLDACVRVLEPDDVRAAFDLVFRRFSQSMDMLLPDPRALAYHADLRWLGKIRGTARARYRDDRLDLSGCGEKVRALIADAVAADGIQILVKEVQLFSPEFDEKVDALATDDTKASEMEYAIRHEISVRAAENPAFYQSLRERLEEIIAERRQERLDAARQLELLHRARRLVAEGRRAAADAQPHQAAAPRERHRRRRGGESRRRYRGPRQGARRPMTIAGTAGVTETSSVSWGGTRLKYAIHRSTRRRKTVAVTVDPAGSILVVAPERLAVARLDAIVVRKAGWLVRRLRHTEDHNPPPAPREFVSGESVLYLGRHYRLKVRPDETGPARLRGGWLHVPAPAGAQQAARVRTAMIAWFRRHAAARLPERAEAWRTRAGVAPPRVIIADQRKRWGSCDHRGTIRLNWRIPPESPQESPPCSSARAATAAAMHGSVPQLPGVTSASRATALRGDVGSW